MNFTEINLGTMRKFVFIILILLPIISSAKDFILKGKVQAWNDQKVYLLSYYGDKINLIDSTNTNSKGEFQINIKKELPAGLYRIAFTDKKHFELIFNKENIEILTHISDPFNHLMIIQSKENDIYHDYIKKRNYDQYRIELLQPVMAYYPLDDHFYPVLLKEYNNIQDSLSLYINNIIKEERGTLAAKLIETDRRPKLDPQMTQAQQKEYAKKHFFDNKRFNDTSLLHTNVITKNILSYLSLFQNNKMSKDEVEASFIKAVDKILPAMQSNKTIYEYVVEYLIGGFEQFGFSKVITHLASKMEAVEDCENEELKHRIETLKKLSKGNTAPDIEINGKKLSAIEKDLTLVVFYASWCSLCNELLPQIHEIYKDRKDELEVYAVSIDTSRTEYNHYIKKYNYPWIEVCDFKGWDTKAALDYGIYVTPNLFLLDNKKRVLGRPTDIIDLDILLSK